MAARLDTEGQTSGDRYPNLETQIAKMLPTPTSHDATGRETRPAGKTGNHHTSSLGWVILERQGKSHDGGWYLNPAFVEEMMAWPIGWTALKPSETAKIQEWQQRHSAFFHKGSSDAVA